MFRKRLAAVPEAPEPPAYVLVKPSEPVPAPEEARERKRKRKLRTVKRLESGADMEDEDEAWLELDMVR
jgi:hypothetical protein